MKGELPSAKCEVLVLSTLPFIYHVFSKDLFQIFLQSGKINSHLKQRFF